MSWLSFSFSWLVAAAGCSAQEVSFQSFFTLGAERCFCTILTWLVGVSRALANVTESPIKKTPRVLLCPWLPLLWGGECSKDGQGKQQQVSKGGNMGMPIYGYARYKKALPSFHIIGLGIDFFCQIRRYSAAEGGININERWAPEKD